jgi:mRNA interferase MazF
VRRSEVWWADLPDPIASEPGYRRPIVIIQDDAINMSKLNTIVGASITGEVRWADHIGNVLISGRGTGLRGPSVVNVTQLVMVDRRFMTERIGRLTATQMAKVDAGLRLVLGLY